MLDKFSSVDDVIWIVESKRSELTALTSKASKNPHFKDIEEHIGSIIKFYDDLITEQKNEVLFHR
jgi:hypothetical protein